MEIIKKLFAHDAWAIRRILDALKRNENKTVLKTLSHLLTTEKVWLMRLHGEDTSEIEIQPELTLNECENLAIEMQAAYKVFLDKVSETGLDNKITYKNYAGTKFQTPIGDVLTHVALHGNYHRGQIARAIRAHGVQPANTDFINFVREETAENG